MKCLLSIPPALPAPSLPSLYSLSVTLFRPYVFFQILAGQKLLLLLSPCLLSVQYWGKMKQHPHKANSLPRRPKSYTPRNADRNHPRLSLALFVFVARPYGGRSRLDQRVELCHEGDEPHQVAGDEGDN